MGKIILAKQSEFFSAMLSHPCMESRNDEMVVEDFDAPTVELFIDFLYKAGLQEKGCTTQLLVMADKYGVRGLKKVCQNYLATHLDNDNVVDAWITAEMAQAPMLKMATFNFLAEHWSEKEK